MKDLKKILLRTTFAGMLIGLSSCALYNPSIIAYRNLEGKINFKLVNKANENWKYNNEERNQYVFLSETEPIKKDTLNYKKEE